MFAGGDFPDILINAGNELKKLRYEKDDHIYFLASAINPQEVSEPNQCLLIQYDVLDKLGYPELKTLADVEQALKDYLALVPDLNGQAFVPWGFCLDTWGYNITMNNPALWGSTKQSIRL